MTVSRTQPTGLSNAFPGGGKGGKGGGGCYSLNALGLCGYYYNEILHVRGSY